MDFWLAQTVGILVAGIGGVLLLGAARKRLTTELEALGVASAAGLGLVDLVFSLRGRISKVYLLDAAVEAALVVGWSRRLSREARPARSDAHGRHSRNKTPETER
jgi:ABC-type cobalamin transport system permease subunit